MSADPAQPSATTAGASTAVSASPPATAVAQAVVQDLLAEDMEATAMSIDTPSYARSLGMGQSGSATGFAGGMFHASQDLAQSMSIDGAHAMQSGDSAAPLNPGGSVRNGVVTDCTQEEEEEDYKLYRHKETCPDMNFNAACPNTQQPCSLYPCNWSFRCPFAPSFVY